MANVTVDQVKEPLAKTTMFFAGLILLIPHRIGMSRVNYVIKRYNLPISRAGLLLYKFHNPIEVSLIIGNVIGFAFTFVADQAKALQGCMIGVCSAMLLSSIFMFIIYISGGDYGHLNLFYFSLIIITLFDGATNPFAFACNGPNASLYAAAIPVSGALVSLLHNIYKLISDYFHLDDFDYYVLFFQLLYNIIILFITIILWACSHVTNGNVFTGLELTNADTSNWTELFNDHAADWSPIGMLAISLGTVYAFYPSIAPYSIIDYQYASVIELWILVISSSPTLLFAILDFVLHKTGGGDWKPIGPGTCNSKDTTNYSGKGNWSSPNPDGSTIDNYFFLWHCVWLCAIPYILCIQIFMTMLHYPDSLLSRFFKNHPYRIGFISVLFNTLRETMQACGFAGAGKQTSNIYEETGYTYSSAPSTAGTAKWEYYDGKTAPAGTDKLYIPTGTTVNGSIASCNKLITLFVMMFCVFTGDGYLQHYRRCCRDCWPTTGYSKYQSFFYWLRYGFKGGSKSFTTAFTDMYHRNIRPQIISYA